MTFDRAKFSELVLYIAHESVGDPNFGKTKLNKVLFYADFLAYGIHGHSITGATYQRRDYGPVPREITSVRTSLVDRGDADVEQTWRFNYPQERLIAKRPPNLSIFTEEEIALVDSVIKELWSHSALAASELSHREVGWKVAGDRETIPYETVFLSNRMPTLEDISRGQEVFALAESATG